MKRVYIEIINLLKKYNNIAVNLKNKSINIKLIVNNYEIKLELNNYPLNPPIVFINNKKYFDIFNLNFYKKYICNILSTNFICLNIISKISRQKWKPIYNLNDVISEILFMLKVKERIKYRFLIDKIVNKYFKRDMYMSIKKYI